MLQKCYHHFFIFAVFDLPLVITPLTGVINYVFCIYYSIATNKNININH